MVQTPAVLTFRSETFSVELGDAGGGVPLGDGQGSADGVLPSAESVRVEIAIGARCVVRDADTVLAPGHPRYAAAASKDRGEGSLISMRTTLVDPP